MKVELFCYRKWQLRHIEAKENYKLLETVCYSVGVVLDIRLLENFLCKETSNFFSQFKVSSYYFVTARTLIKLYKI